MRYFFISALLFFVEMSFAQQMAGTTLSHIDSLKKVDQLLSLSDSLSKATKVEEEKLIDSNLLVWTNALYGANHPRYGDILIKLGACYENMGTYDSALVMYDRLLAVRKTSAGENSRQYAEALYYIGNAYYLLQLFDTALIPLNKASVIYKNISGENSRDYANTISKIGDVYQEMGNYDQALPYLRKAIEINKAVMGENHPDYANAMFNLARLYRYMGEPEKSLTCYKETREIDKKVFGENSKDYALAINDIALLYTQSQVGDFNSVLDNYEKSLSIYKRLYGNNSPYCAMVLNNMGYFYINTASYDKAQPCLDTALKIAQQTLGENHPNCYYPLKNLGNLYRMLGQYDKALPYLTRAVNIVKATLSENHRDYAGAMNNLGDLYYFMGHYDKALPYYHKSMEIFKNKYGEKSRGYLQALSNLGKMYQETSNYDKALPCLQKAVEIIKQTQGEVNIDYGLALYYLGVLYKEMGQYDNALSMYLKVKDVRKKIFGENHPDYADILNEIGLFYTQTQPGNFEEPMKYYTKALEIYKKVFGEQHPNCAMVQNNIGLLYKNNGMYDKALPYLLKSDEIAKKALGDQHPNYAFPLKNLGKLYQEMGQFDKALPCLLKSAEIRKNSLGENHPDYSVALMNLALLYLKMNNVEKAMTELQTSIDIYTRYLGNGTRYLNQKNLLQFIRKDFNNFELAYSLALSTQNNALCRQALQSELLFKGIALQDSKDLTASLLKTTDKSLLELVDKLKQTRNLMSLLTQKHAPKEKLDSVDNSLNHQEEELVQRSPEYQQLVGSRNINWEQVQHKLKANEAAIEFVHFRYWNNNWTDTIQYAAFLVLPNGEPRLVNLCTQKMLEQRINDKLNKDEAYVKLLYTVKERGITLGNGQRDTAASLYQLIWQPMDSLLKGISTIYYSPSGLLHRINLAAINYSGNKVLADKFHFHLLGSTREVVYYESPFADIKQDTILAYGGIKFDADSTELANQHRKYFPDPNQSSIVSRSGDEDFWPELPATEEEVGAIKSLTVETGMQCRAYSGADATEESFKNYTGQNFAPAFIHVATHGFFIADEQRVLNNRSNEGSVPYFIGSSNVYFRSGIVFAGANRALSGKPALEGIEDGVVTAFDIANANLQRTKLMVLSACETGLGKIENTEGVFGLQRAIRMAGCKNLIMSLWKVPDEQTNRFMQYFYQGLIRQHQNVYEAFSSAQQQMKSLYSGQPYNWAGFVLME